MLCCVEVSQESSLSSNDRVVMQELNPLPPLFSDLLSVEPHVPTPEPVTYDKKDGEWYTHEGVDVKETLQRKGWSF